VLGDFTVTHNTSALQIISKNIVDQGGLSVYVNNPDMGASGLELLRRIEPNRPLVVMLEDIDAIIIVDDCCPEKSGSNVEYSCTDPRVKVIYHESNQGVGGAVLTGFRAAIADGAGVIVKVDGDGQMDVGLILMDIVMPDIDGIEACQIIHASEKYSDTPLIIVTARHKADDIETAFYAGALYYVTKPLNRVELLARVHSALRLKEEVDRCKVRELELEEARREIIRLRAMLQETAKN